MGKLTAALGIVPVLLVAAYFCLLAVNVLTLFRPTLSIPFIHEVRGATDASGRPLQPGHGPYWPADQRCRLALRLSEHEEPARPEDSERVWQSAPFLLEDTAATAAFPIEAELSVPLPVQHRQLTSDLYAHIYLYPVGESDEAAEEAEEEAEVADAHPELDAPWMVRQTVPLIRYQPLVVKEDRLLMSREAPDAAVPAKKPPSTPIAHWVPQIEMHLLTDRTEYPRNAVPADIHAHMLWLKRNGTFAYLPVIAPNPLLLGPDDLVPLVDVDGALTTATAIEALQLRVVLTSLGWFRISRLLWTTLQSFGDATNPSAGFRLSSSEIDQFRQMIVRTDPWLLLATIVASVLHLLFEWLAFKEDVAHWSKLKNTAGVSKMAVLLEMISRC
ncbi:cleft lip and palate transmembrane 1, partial [Syncephalis pseudoplumigaleata]